MEYILFNSDIELKPQPRIIDGVKEQWLNPQSKARPLWLRVFCIKALSEACLVLQNILFHEEFREL